MKTLLSTLFVFTTSILLSGCNNYQFNSRQTASSSQCQYRDKVLVATSAGINITDTTFSSFSQTITTTNGLPSNSVYMLHKHNNILFAATSAGLVIFSTDCALSVSRVVTTANGLPSNNVGKIYTAPDDSLWVVTDAGVARSTDNGVTFSSYITTATPGMALANFNAGGVYYTNSIAFSPTTDTVVIGLSGRVCRSTDLGASFVCTQPSTVSGNGNSNTVTGVVAMNNGNFVISTGFRFFISSDDGATWTLGPVPGNNWINSASYDSTTDTLYLGTSGWSSLSTDSGASVTNFGAGSGGLWGAFPISSGHILLATVTGTQGLYVGEDNADLTAGTTTSYTTANGLLNNRIYWVLYLN